MTDTREWHRVREALSFVVGGIVALAVLYLGYLAGMAWQFETMVQAQPRSVAVVLAGGRFGGT